jgi:hypothetical protein
MSLFVKVKHGAVIHNDKEYRFGDQLPEMTPEQAQQLLESGAVQTQSLDNGVVPNLVPTEDEIKQVVQEVAGK